MRSVLILPCWKTEVADGAGQSPPLRSGGGGAAQSAVTEGASPPLLLSNLKPQPR